MTKKEPHSIPNINGKQLEAIQELLGYNNLRLGKELGFHCNAYQCKQIENLIAGTSVIKPTVVLALECLARRKNKLREFNRIVEPKKEEE